MMTCLIFIPQHITMKKQLPSSEASTLLKTLQTRFEKNAARHKGINWKDVEAKLHATPGKLWSLQQMEATGGEPDVVGFNKQTKEYIFFDCSAESPKDRRSICYDDGALQSRKENKPKNSAINMAEEMGINILDESQYRQLQELGSFDTKTSSWIQTPAKIRELGGALFCDRRYNTIFLYHNGAESYYAARGFRGFINV